MDKWFFKDGLLWYLVAPQPFYSLERAVGTLRMLNLKDVSVKKISVIEAYKPQSALWVWLVSDDTTQASKHLSSYEDIRVVTEEEIEEENKRFDERANQYFK